MSKMAEISYEIQELFIDGHSARSIAQILEVPVEFVLVALESFGAWDEVEEVEDTFEI